MGVFLMLWSIAFVILIPLAAEVWSIKEGVMDSSSATLPKMQGVMCVLMLWRPSLGLKLPVDVQTFFQKRKKLTISCHLDMIAGR